VLSLKIGFFGLYSSAAENRCILNYALLRNPSRKLPNLVTMLNNSRWRQRCFIKKNNNENFFAT